MIHGLLNRGISDEKEEKKHIRYRRWNTIPTVAVLLKWDHGPSWPPNGGCIAEVGPRSQLTAQRWMHCWSGTTVPADYPTVAALLKWDHGPSWLMENN